MSDDPQRITKKQTDDDSYAISMRIRELQQLGYPRRQATAIALRQFGDNELVVAKREESPTLRAQRRSFNAIKTLALLSSLLNKTAKKQQKEQEKEQNGTA